MRLYRRKEGHNPRRIGSYHFAILNGATLYLQKTRSARRVTALNLWTIWKAVNLRVGVREPKSNRLEQETLKYQYVLESIALYDGESANSKVMRRTFGRCFQISRSRCTFVSHDDHCIVRSKGLTRHADRIDRAKWINDVSASWEICERSRRGTEIPNDRPYCCTPDDLTSGHHRPRRQASDIHQRSCNDKAGAMIRLPIRRISFRSRDARVRSDQC